MDGVNGVIIDLRGNSGGEIEGMPDLFLNEKTLLYFRRTRESEIKVFSDPRDGGANEGPPVVLMISWTRRSGT
jgi:C-terminal processing protease CtpA/Prc